MQDARNQVGRFEQGECGLPFAIAHVHRHRFSRLQRLVDGSFLQGFQPQQHAAHVGLEDVFLDLQFDGGMGDVACALPRRIEVQGVHVKRFADRYQQVHLEQFEREIFCEAAHTVAAVAQGERDFVAGDDARHVVLRGRWHRTRGQRSQRAAEVSVYVVRAFVALRELLTSNKELALKLSELESRIERKLDSHDQAIAGLIHTMRELMRPPEPPKKRPIGFITGEEKTKKDG